MRAKAAVLTMAVALGLAVAAKESDDPGARRLGREYRCYRSFQRQLERTADFAKMGITTRCVFAPRPNDKKYYLLGRKIGPEWFD